MNPKILYDHYIMREFTIAEIAEKFGTTYYKIYYQMAKCGITKRLQPIGERPRRTKPFMGKYFLKKVGGFYYPLKGGEDMNFETAQAITTLSAKAPHLLEKVVDLLDGTKADMLKLKDVVDDGTHEITLPEFEDRTSEELTDEQLQAEVERGEG